MDITSAFEAAIPGSNPGEGIMPKRFYYIFSLFFVFILPVLAAGVYVIPKIPVPNLFVFVVGITIVGAMWDIWATRHGKRDPVWLWQFNKKTTLGINFFGLPIEEYIFYVSSSTYVIFLWEIIRLALETKSVFYYLSAPTFALWTLVTVMIPYRFGKQNDRLQ